MERSTNGSTTRGAPALTGLGRLEDQDGDRMPRDAAGLAERLQYRPWVARLLFDLGEYDAAAALFSEMGLTDLAGKAREQTRNEAGGTRRSSPDGSSLVQIRRDWGVELEGFEPSTPCMPCKVMGVSGGLIVVGFSPISPVNSWGYRPLVD